MSLQTTEQVIKEAEEGSYSVKLTAYQLGCLSGILKYGLVNADSDSEAILKSVNSAISGGGLD